MSHPKNCKEIRFDLIPLIEGRLDQEAQTSIRHHLAECEDCAAAHDELKETLELLDENLPVRKPSDRLHDRLMSRVKEAQWESSLRYRTEVKVAAAVVAVLGVACLAWLIKINDPIVAALHEMLASLGMAMPWLTEGFLAPYLAPVLFVLLCSFLTLLVSPLLLRKKYLLKVPAPAKEKQG